MRRSALQLGAFRKPLWRRPAAWQLAALALALLPLLGWGWESVRAPEPAPVAAPPSQSPPSPLRILARAEQPPEAGRIALHNLFTPSRNDWALAAAPAQADPDADAVRRQREERRKVAMTEVDKITFVATIRSADDWAALVDTPDRKPGDDLLTLRPGDAFKSWKVGDIGRDSLILSFEGEERLLPLGPRIAASKQSAAPAPSGRSKVEVRPPPPGDVAIDPPISREEATRKLRESIDPGDEKLRRLVDEMLESMERKRAEPAKAPAAPEKKS